MSVALSPPRMTRAAFLDWAQTQEIRYEFDGFAPVAMTGATANHGRIAQNLWGALRTRLKGGPCEALGPDAGVATIGDAVRYPDALVSCTRVSGTAHLINDVVVVLEVLSPTSGHTDRIEKVRECHAVPSILRYVILEHTSAALTVFERAQANNPWIATTLTGNESLIVPELGIEIPVAELYEDVDLPSAETHLA
jgi:Uma2 family endonuclease